jgi:hypothetical protein
MKNIHILPTDKPSSYVTNYLEQNMQWQNIYITSDEAIKEGNWIIWNNKVVKAIDTTYWSVKKIILTTDQDLIKNGVQAIDDKFLEWFVKNPSCEKVEIKKGKLQLNDDGQEYGFPDMSLYKIIIPQEEAKKLTDEEIAIKLEEIEREETKQETLEQAAENYAHNNFNMHETNSYKELKKGFEAGVKWQAETMYNEAIEFAEWIRIKDFQTASKNNWIGLDMKYYTTQELFEQFKKK